MRPGVRLPAVWYSGGRLRTAPQGMAAEPCRGVWLSRKMRQMKRMFPQQNGDIGSEAAGDQEDLSGAVFFSAVSLCCDSVMWVHVVCLCCESVL